MCAIKFMSTVFNMIFILDGMHCPSMVLSKIAKNIFTIQNAKMLAHDLV